MACTLFLALAATLPTAQPTAQPTALPTAMPNATTNAKLQLSVCLVHVQMHYFASSGQVTVVLAQGTEAADEALLGMTAPQRLVVVEDAVSVPPALDVHNYVTDLVIVVLGDDEKDVATADAVLRAVLEALPRNPMLAVLLAVTNDDLMSVGLRTLWEHGLLNAVVIVPRGESLAAFSYKPYSQCHGPGTAVLVDTWSGNGWEGGSTIFPRNRNLQLNGCMLTCGTGLVPWAVIVSGDGADGTWSETARGVVVSMLRELSRRLNFRLHLQPQRPPSIKPDWGWVYPNGTGKGLLGDVLTGTVDMVAGDLLPIADRHNLLDLVRPMRFTCLTWAVPTRMGAWPSGLQNIHREFAPAMWMSLLLTACASSVIAWFLANRLPTRKARGRFASFYFLAAFVAASFIGVPRPRVPALCPLRVFLATWFCFATVLNTAYIASLRLLLEDPWIRGEIRTLRGILEAGLTVITHPNLYESLSELGEENSTVAELSSKVEFEEQNGVSIRQVVGQDRRAACLVARMTGNYYATLLQQSSHGRKVVHILPDYCLLNLPSSPLVLPKGSPLTRVFDDLIQRFYEGGIIWMWASRYVEAERRTTKRYASDDDVLDALGLDNLTGAFLLLLVGFHVAILAFALEYAVFKNRTRLNALLNRARRRRRRRRRPVRTRVPERSTTRSPMRPPYAPLHDVADHHINQ